MTDPTTEEDLRAGARIVPLLGLDLTDLAQSAVLARLAARPATAPFRYVATPNADHFVRLARRPELVPLYRRASLCLLDSRVVAQVARLAGLPAPQVVTGSDLTAALLGQVVARDDPLTILGGTGPVVDAVRARFGLRRVAHFDPPMGFDRDPAAFAEAVAFIEAHPARFTLLAVGSPRQCAVASAVLERGRAQGIGLCIGASLLFLAGAERRAPLPVQRAGLEWAWRLAADPRRLARRYLVDNPVILRLLWQEARQRGATPPGAVRLPR